MSVRSALDKPMSASTDQLLLIWNLLFQPIDNDSASRLFTSLRTTTSAPRITPSVTKPSSVLVASTPPLAPQAAGISIPRKRWSSVNLE